MDLEFRNGKAGNAMAPDQNEKNPEAPPFAQAAPAQDESKKPTIVKVRSAGRFEFVVATNVATFEDEVRVYQPTEPGKYNSLQSDLMTLYFEPKKKVPNASGDPPPEAKPEAAPPQKDRFQSVDSNLTFRRLVAVGENVILRSETNDLIAMMHQLDYDALKRAAEMTSRATVRVLQKQSEMHSPNIQLWHQEGGRVTHLNAARSRLAQEPGQDDRQAVFRRPVEKITEKGARPAVGRGHHHLGVGSLGPPTPRRDRAGSGEDQNLAETGGRIASVGPGEDAREFGGRTNRPLQSHAAHKTGG